MFNRFLVFLDRENRNKIEKNVSYNMTTLKKSVNEAFVSHTNNVVIVDNSV